MSEARSRARRSQRLHQKRNIIRQQLAIAKSHGLEVKHPHKLAKHHAMNCGNPRCILCSNPRRTRKEKTIQEKRAEQTPLDE